MQAMEKSLTFVLLFATAFSQFPAHVFAQTPEEPCVYDTDFNQRCLQEDGSILVIPNPFFEGREHMRAAATLFEMSAAWNGTPLSTDAPTQLQTGVDGNLSWSYVVNPVDPFAPYGGHVVPFNPIFESATLTLDVFQGELGSSTRIASTPVSHGETPDLTVRFDTPGKYVIALSATYERTDEGTVPGLTAADLCTGPQGELCPVASFPLEPFRNFIEHGKENEDGAPQLPVMYDLLEIEVVEGVVSGASNVLFLPGFLTSRLYTKEGEREELLWEPIGTSDVKKLALGSDGTSPITVYTRDIIDSVLNLPYSTTIYGKFMGYLDELKQEGKIADWKGYSYDWRYDVLDVVRDGALKENGSREYLVSEVERLAASSKSGRVTIIGHSNGGLLAKALMVKLAAEGKTGLVDRVIFIATPQTGTPKGLSALLHGREIDLQFWIPSTVRRDVAATFPGAYTLIPSAAYFEDAAAPIATFAPGAKTTAFTNVYGPSLDTAAEAESFALNNPATRPAPTAGDTGTPLPLSSALVAKAKATHAILDTWTPALDVQVYEIAGWGQSTMSGADYVTKEMSCFSLSCPTYIEYTPKLTDDGDETVLTRSAVFQGKAVYFNLAELNDQFGETRIHKNITESAHMHAYLANLLGLDVSFEENLFPIAKPESSESKVIVGVHSPAIIAARDSDGHQTGIFSYDDTNNDLKYVREGIPGSSIELGGEAKYLVLPADRTYDIAISGTGSGVFDLTFANENGEVFREFSKLPVGSSTQATVTVSGSGVSQLSLDIDGDGTTDANISDKLTRKDAIGICKKEIGRVRTLFVRLYLTLVMSNMEHQGRDAKKFQNLVNNLRKHVEANLKAIPPERAAAIATCVRALENSKK